MKTNIFILNRVTNSDTNYSKMRYVPLLNDSSLRRTPRWVLKRQYWLVSPTSENLNFLFPKIQQLFYLLFVEKFWKNASLEDNIFG